MSTSTQPRKEDKALTARVESLKKQYAELNQLKNAQSKQPDLSESR